MSKVPQTERAKRGRSTIASMTTLNFLWAFILTAALFTLVVACGQDPAPSPIIIVATPTPVAAGDSSQSEGQLVTAESVVKQPIVRQPAPKLKDWTPRQHAAVDQAIKDAYGVFVKDLDECIGELGQPSGGPFKDDLARYEAAVTQPLFLECIQRKLIQG